MSVPRHILAIDQGTTSSRAIVFDADLKIVAVAQEELPQHFPAPGWVEHDPEDIWRTVLSTARAALAKAGLSARDIAGIGITNQREITVIWERATGRPIHRAIVWQDRRTADDCRLLADAGHGPRVTAATGLLLDPYFSGTKIAWILDHIDGVRKRAERGELAFGTVDSFLLWQFTGGKVHATDATNASRTLLYNIHSNTWDAALCDLLRVPMGLLPDVRDCAAEFGRTASQHLGAEVPILGIAGDQQAALIGQACFKPGMMKATYGTGCFAVLNTGAEAVTSQSRLLTTIGYRLGGATTYALEGSIFIAGAAVQWLRDGLNLMKSAAEAGPMAERADAGQDVILVPAFVGLGAPYWDAEARGAIFGLTRGTGPNELARAALEAVCYQTADLLEAMRRDWPGQRDTVLRVDGGMVASDWTMQRLADLIGAPVDRPTARRRLSRGAASWPLPGTGAVRRTVGTRPHLLPPHEGARTRASLGRLAGCRESHAWPAHIPVAFEEARAVIIADIAIVQAGAGDRRATRHIAGAPATACARLKSAYCSSQFWGLAARFVLTLLLVMVMTWSVEARADGCLDEATLKLVADKISLDVEFRDEMQVGEPVNVIWRARRDDQRALQSRGDLAARPVALV